MRWCPAPDCSLAIQINSSLRMDYVQNCTCTCGEQFCFDCGDECHDPLPCYLFSKWKMDRLCATALDVKKCPNPDCVVRFEKDGGCNYMVSDFLLLFLYYFTAKTFVAVQTVISGLKKINFSNVLCVNTNFVGRAVAIGTILIRNCTTIVYKVVLKMATFI